ncbi:MAG: hypothetical protein HY080_07995 [Gammaproteobacteria bacterium]|nr:hypothetical protein [Gammaproteobacteria bacterium]
MSLTLRHLTLLGLICGGLMLGCAPSTRRDEGGIVGSGTKIDCGQQPTHPSCNQQPH